MEPTQQVSNFLNSYAKSINRAYQRTGSLFQGRFGRIEVTLDQYFVRLVHYIHFNPQKHGFVAEFRTYPYSSYPAMLLDSPTKLMRAQVLDCFNGRSAFEQTHRQVADEKKIAYLIRADVE